MPRRSAAIISAGAGAAAGVFMVSLGFPVVITFVAVVVVGFAVGVKLTELDREYRLTERVRARFMDLEAGIVRELPAAKQVLVAAGYEAGKLGMQAGQEIKAGYYKVDRFFSSAGDMLRSEAVSVRSAL